jgi:molybdopterin-guanine dinucleotide biosynthesis protein A
MVVFPEGIAGTNYHPTAMASWASYFRVPGMMVRRRTGNPDSSVIQVAAFSPPQANAHYRLGREGGPRRTKSNPWNVYHHVVEPVTAFILAGGKSSRMGQDKAFLRLGDRTLLAHALQLARAVSGNAWIVGSTKKFAHFGPVAEDVYPERGPLAGIHAALTRTSTDLNLIIAVDLPFLQPGLLNYLISQARETAAGVVVPRAGGGLQPLCALYRRNFAEVAERLLRAGKNKIAPLFAEVTTRIIEREELERNGFPEDMFRNLNTEKDWEEAKQMFSGELA